MEPIPTSALKSTMVLPLYTGERDWLCVSGHLIDGAAEAGLSTSDCTTLHTVASGDCRIAFVIIVMTMGMGREMCG